MLIQVRSRSFLVEMVVCHNFVVNFWRHLDMLTYANEIVLRKALNNHEILNIH
jgi:hypothetical protein